MPDVNHDTYDHAGIPGVPADGSYQLVVDEDGSSFANFTANTGTWASAGGIISQSASPSATHHRARYNTKFPVGQPWVIEAEIRLPASGSPSSNGGLMIGYDGAAETAGLAVSLVGASGSTGVQVERSTAAVLRLLAVTIAQDTWYKLRVVGNGVWVAAYLDGVLLGGAIITSLTGPTPDYLGLFTFNAKADFRNIKAWSMVLPA